MFDKKVVTKQHRPAPVALAVAIAMMGASAPAFAAADTDTVKITGIRASKQSSLNAKKNATGMVEVITAEDVGKMPDKNVADALSRVAGVNTSSASGGEGGFDENDRVSMRGTSASLTQTMVNGHTIGTGDWFVLSQVGGGVGRSVSLTLLPSELIGKITVHKSPNASLVEGGSVGAIDVETRKPFDLKKGWTFDASVQGAYGDLVDKTDSQLSALAGYRGDTFGFMVQGFNQKRSLRRDGVEYFAWSEITNADVLAATPALKGVKAPTWMNAAMFEQEREKTGGAVELQWKPTAGVTLGLSALRSEMTADNFNTSMLYGVNRFINAGQSPTNYRVENGQLVAGTFAPNPAVNSFVSDAFVRPGAGSETEYYVANAKFKISDAINVSAQLGTTEGIGISDNETGAEWFHGNLGVSYALDGLNAPKLSTTPGSAAHSISTFPRSTTGFDWMWGPRGLRNTDSEDFARVDFDWKATEGMVTGVKSGLRYAAHERDIFYGKAIGPTWGPNDGSFNPAHWPNADQYPSDFGSGFGGSYTPVYRFNRESVQKFADTYANVSEARGPYYPGMSNVQEDTLAGYVMADLQLADDVEANVGLRVIKTDMSSAAYSPTSDRTKPGYVDSIFAGGPPTWVDPTGYYVSKVERSYTDVLPSASFKFTPVPNVIIRGSVAKTMTRPDFGAISAAQPSLNNVLLSGDGGNPYLNPTRAIAMDLGVEWYFAKNSMVSAAVFSHQFSSYAVPGQYVGNFLDESTKTIKPYTITSYVNGKANNSGFELSFQKPLWGNFGMASNYTFASGESEGAGGVTGKLAGNSRHTGNLEGYYEDDKFSARVAYTYRSEFLAGIDRSAQLNMDATHNLAASVNYKLTDNITLTFDALNLNNPTLKYYGDNKSQPLRIYNSGRQFYFGVKASM